MSNLSTIEEQRIQWFTLRNQYDPFYEFSDDHVRWSEHFRLRRELSYLRAELGLWGQDLVIPVCQSDGTMKWV